MSINKSLSHLTKKELIQLVEELSSVKEHYEQLIENPLVGVYIIQDKIVKFCNTQFAKLFGYDGPQDIIGTNIISLTSQVSWEEVKNEIRSRELGDKEYSHYEFNGIRKDGSIIDIEVFGGSILYEGKFATQGILIDITDHKMAIKKLMDSESRGRAVLNAYPDLMFHITGKGICLNFNGPQEDLAVPPDKVIGNKIRYLIPDPLGKEIMQKIKTTLHTHNIQTLEYQMVTIDNNVKNFESRIVPSGKNEVLVFCRNVTKNKQDEMERKKLEEELAQSQKMEAIGSLAGGIAHDFNNILSSIMGYSELSIMDLPDVGKVKERLQLILKASERAAKLVKQILTFGRKIPIEKMPIHLPQIIQEVFLLLRSTIPSTIEIKQNIHDNIGLISADTTQIHQVIMNLCTNSAQAIGAKIGVIEITLKEVDLDSNHIKGRELIPDRYLSLSVSDNGCGMTQKVIDRIFEPFYTTKRIDQGTGMGLSVVHGIIKSHGGDITVYSEPGVGSTFNIYLPMIKEADISKTFIPKKEIIKRGSERILFVDDEANLVKLGQEILTIFGYKVIGRTSSIEALEFFKSNPDKVDLIITDFTMPNMDGVRLSREIHKIRPDIPIILCSGITEGVNENISGAKEISAFIMKPFIMADFMQTIQKVVHQEN